MLSTIQLRNVQGWLVCLLHDWHCHVPWKTRKQQVQAKQSEYRMNEINKRCISYRISSDKKRMFGFFTSIWSSWLTYRNLSYRSISSVVGERNWQHKTEHNCYTFRMEFNTITQRQTPPLLGTRSTVLCLKFPPVGITILIFNVGLREECSSDQTRASGDRAPVSFSETC